MRKQRAKPLISTGDLARKGILSWMFAVMVEYLAVFPEHAELAGLDGIASMSFAGLVLKAAGAFILLLFLGRLREMAGAERWMMLIVFLVLAIFSLIGSFSWGYAAGCILLGIMFAVYVCCGWNAEQERIQEPSPFRSWQWGVTAGLTFGVFLFIGVWTVGRVYSFSTPTYDFGIFSQMFYNMRKTGQPVTTVERDGLLSHFSVHVSPIYYLMLPVYWLFPCPETLQILQAAVVVSGVIPLWLLGKAHGMSGFQRMVLCAVLLFYPAYTGGTSYDLHENCFLTPLILWLFYGIDEKKGWITGVSALLILMVKEDAAVYVAVIGLFLLARGVLRQEEKRTAALGGGLLGVSLLWFLLVTGYLAEQGDGVMTYRYGNFMYDGSGSLITVVKAVLLNPMKAVYECLEPEKLGYIAMTLGPLLVLPLMTRRYERYILLIPYVLVNLMSDYEYQHSIWFQYNFGSIAFLMYLLVVNTAEWKQDVLRSLALVLALVVCFCCFVGQIVPTGLYYPRKAVENASQYQQIRDVLEEIPEDASVCATTFLTTFLSEREILYDVGYASREHLLKSEYIVLDLTRTSPYTRYATGGKENGLENLIRLLEGKGYTTWRELDGLVLILKKD